MRILIGLMIGFFLMSPSMADNVLKPVTDLSEFSGANSANKITWNNQRPEQQRALTQFYRSMTPSASTRPSLERQQHAQELRSMNPKQRQQLFLNYIQQNR
ncbi:MAG: hypothetical protein ACI9OH_000683 [Oleispira sp.]|jgi:hypothetical protein